MPQPGPARLFSLDGLAHLPVFNKHVLLAYLAYRASNLPWLPSLEALRTFDWSSLRLTLPPSWSAADTSLKFTYALLAIYAGDWLNHRWRNGLRILGAPARIRGEQQWKRELALVTGGAQGIGRATAELLASKGCNVAVIDIVECKAWRPNIKTYRVDISSGEQLRAVQKKIRTDFAATHDNPDPGHVTMMLNIAGLNNHSLILDLDEARISRMVNVNLKSHLLAANIFLGDMIRQKRGHFLSVGSTMSFVGICHQSDYVATKHALVGLHESLQYELLKMYKTPYVRTSLAVIGHTDTGLFKDFKVPHALARFLGPLVTPESIAMSIVDALEAQESRYIYNPFINRTVTSLKALPSFLRDGIQWAAGGDGTYSSRPTPEQLGTA